MPPLSANQTKTLPGGSLKLIMIVANFRKVQALSGVDIRTDGRRRTILLTLLVKDSITTGPSPVDIAPGLATSDR